MDFVATSLNETDPAFWDYSLSTQLENVHINDQDATTSVSPPRDAPSAANCAPLRSHSVKDLPDISPATQFTSSHSSSITTHCQSLTDKMNQDYENTISNLLAQASTHVSQPSSSTTHQQARQQQTTILSSSGITVVAPTDLSSSTPSNTSSRALPAFPPILYCNVAQLNPHVELRKRFGSSALPSSSSSSSSSSHTPSFRGAIGRSANFSGGANRYAFKPTPQARRGDVCLVPHVRHLVPPPKLFEMKHGVRLPCGTVLTSQSPAPQSTQYAFFARSGTPFYFHPSTDFLIMHDRFQDAVESYDHNALLEFVRVYPHHPQALLHLAELYEASNEFERALHAVEQALYQFECSFHPEFSLAFSPSTNPGCISSGSYVAVIQDTIGTDPTSFTAICASLATTFSRLLALHAKFLLKKACPITAFQNAQLAIALFPIHASTSTSISISTSSSSSVSSNANANANTNVIIPFKSTHSVVADPCGLMHQLDYYAFRAGFDIVILRALLLMSPALPPAFFSPVPMISEKADLKPASTKARSTLHAIFASTPGLVEGQNTLVRASFLPNWCFTAALALRRLEKATVARYTSDSDSSLALVSTLMDRISRKGAKECPLSLSLSLPSRGEGLEILPNSKSGSISGMPGKSGKSAKSGKSGKSGKSTKGVVDFSAGSIMLEMPSSTQLLQRAILLFPSVFAALVAEIFHDRAVPSEWENLVKQSGGWNFQPVGTSTVIERLAFMHAKRNVSLWKGDDALNFLREAAECVAEKVDAGKLSNSTILAIEYYYSAVLSEETITDVIFGQQISDYSDSVNSLPAGLVNIGLPNQQPIAVPRGEENRSTRRTQGQRRSRGVRPSRVENRDEETSNEPRTRRQQEDYFQNLRGIEQTMQAISDLDRADEDSIDRVLQQPSRVPHRDQMREILGQQADLVRSTTPSTTIGRAGEENTDRGLDRPVHVSPTEQMYARLRQLSNSARLITASTTALLAGLDTPFTVSDADTDTNSDYSMTTSDDESRRAFITNGSEESDENVLESEDDDVENEEGDGEDGPFAPRTGPELD